MSRSSRSPEQTKRNSITDSGPNRRTATRREPTEIADAVGITAQAVSDYLQDLIDHEYVNKRGRGRYVVTKEGVDSVMSRTDEQRHFVQHVSEDVIGEVEIGTALAATEIGEGQTGSLTMRDGVLRATSGVPGTQP